MATVRDIAMRYGWSEQAASRLSAKERREAAEDWKREWGPDDAADEKSARFEADHGAWDESERAA